VTQRAGVVASFDTDAGLGTVTDDAVTDQTSGPPLYGFHCTEIADGTRTIEVGTPVTFVVAPAGPGIWEAKDLHPAAS
jgi:cold shock CspA family protein